MTTRYAILEFSPDPFGALRWPVGAIVEAADGTVRTAESERLPTTPLLSPAESRHLRHLLDRLHQVRSISELPAGLGLHLALSDPRAVMLSIDDAIPWLRRHILPASTPTARGATAATSRPRRRAEGISFLKTHGLAAQVRRGFDPDHDLGGLLKDTRLPEISHWVGIPGNALLMEPMSALRPNFDKELAQTRVEFGSYSEELRRAGARDSVRLVVYLLPGGSSMARDLAFEILRSVDEIVDTASFEHRERFFARIREASALADRQASLIH